MFARFELLDKGYSLKYRYIDDCIPMATPTHIIDTLSRPIRDLRISVTDRCNFRCTYCMPKEVFNSDYEFLRRDDLLSFEEITRISNVFAKLGVKKIRLLSGIDGIEDISLTTNGVLLSKDIAQQLKDAGLKRITISLDALDNETFKSISDVGFDVDKVLQAIEHAQQAGLSPIKVNMVVKKGVNEHSILPVYGCGKYQSMANGRCVFS